MAPLLQLALLAQYYVSETFFQFGYICSYFNCFIIIRGHEYCTMCRFTLLEMDIQTVLKFHDRSPCFDKRSCLCRSMCAYVCVRVWVCPCRVARLCTRVENNKSATVVASGGGLSKSGSLEGVWSFKGCWSHHSYLKYIAHNLKIHKSILVLNWPRDNSFLALPCCLYLLKHPLKHWCLQEACTKETISFVQS